MTEETTEKKRKRLIFRSWHRGTKEMDLILGSFAERNVQNFTEAELAQYDELLQLSDPDLYNWVTGKEEPPANLEGDMFEKLKAHKFPETHSR